MMYDLHFAIFTYYFVFVPHCPSDTDRRLE